ncbi:MAG: ABC-F family ATP-binding cassette domain-containing protein [Chitinophagaceae bacterium]
MHYLSAEKLTKAYGITPLFNNITFHISQGDKIALIARNGTGKSTLLKILSGKETPDEGKIWISKDITVAMFEQDPILEEDKNILDNVLHAKHPAVKAIAQYELAVESNDTNALQDALMLMEELQAWDFEAKVKQILGKLNVHNLQQQVNTLSGGQRKRVALARTLIDIGFEQNHTLLIMDEPTNHLDVEMIEWLENYLLSENVTLLMVTHDRYFLDAVCSEIWELERENMYVYKGDYENYLNKKAARIENEQANIDKAKSEFRKELEWMRKQPKARTTKSKSRQDNFYDIKEKASQKIEDNQLQLQVKMSRIGGKVIELKKVYKSYGEKEIMKGFDYTFNKGERLGIVGKNGVGKSTFLNIIQQIEQPDSGKINIGDTIVIGNFSQQGLVIKENVRVIEYVKNIAENFPLANGGSISAAQFLELFLFTPEKQYTYLNSLSGGEKKRLQLLSILFKNPNFLILDEPTNDLDLPTLAVLENFLQDYPGCVVIVSHDRYFMDKLVDHLLVFEGDGVIKDYPGNYTQYRIVQDEEAAKNKVAKQQATAVVVQEQKQNKKVSFKDKHEFEQLEKEMPKLENEKKEIEYRLSMENLSFDEINKLSLRIGEISQLLEEKEMRWLELSEILA